MRRDCRAATASIMTWPFSFKKPKYFLREDLKPTIKCIADVLSHEKMNQDSQVLEYDKAGKERE
jgi:hypothetical protein